jgi:hypothetical protein
MVGEYPLAFCQKPSSGDSTESSVDFGLFPVNDWPTGVRAVMTTSIREQLTFAFYSLKLQVGGVESAVKREY